MSVSKCGKRCKGYRHHRYCQLTDPEHPDYDPRFLAILAGEPPARPTPDPRALVARATLAKFAARRRCHCYTPPACGCLLDGECSRPDRPLNPDVETCTRCLASEGWTPE